MQNVYDVTEKGAVFDGASHPLSETYSTLGAAQAVFPFVTSLSQQRDWAAFKSAILAAAAFGGVVLLPPGIGIMGNDGIGLVTPARYKSMAIRGQGSDVTEIRVNGTVPVFMDFKYPLGGIWLSPDDPSLAGSKVDFEGFTLATFAEGSQLSTAIRIDGGYQAGRVTRKTLLRDVDFRGVSRFEQFWNRGIDAYDLAHLFMDHCRWVVARPTGDMVYARSRGRPNGGGGYYLNHVEAFGGNSMLNLGQATEGVYMTQCVADGDINYAVTWASEQGGVGLMVTGGQFATNLRVFDLNNVGDIVICGADIRGHGRDWIGVYVNRPLGGQIVGCHFVGRAGNPTQAIFIENTPAFTVRGVNISGNNFDTVAYGVRLMASSQRVQVNDDNKYENVSTKRIDNLNPTGNYVKARQFTNVIAVPIRGGQVNVPIDLPIPLGMFGETPRMAVANSNSSDMIGSYVPSQSAPDRARAYFHLPNFGQIPAGTYQIAYTVYE